MSKIQKKMLELKIEKNYCCSQIMMSIVGLEPLSKENPDIIQAMSALCYGLQCQQDCGVVSGGACALALHTKEPALLKERVTELFEWFEDEFGSISCEDILGKGCPPNAQCYNLVEAAIKKCFSILDIPAE